MEKEIWKGTQFISSLIDYSRLDVANPVPCDVNGILKECCSHVPFSDRIQIHFSLQEDIPCIHGDKERLKQAFSHLMVNAAEAMAIGGTLTISTKRRGDCLEVDFLDTGSGIKNEDYARLAEPFYSTKGTDLGLGLLFCQSVLQCHGGSLSIQSVPGKGTLCQVRIATPS
jgi:signal transduction histidine kinase